MRSSPRFFPRAGTIVGLLFVTALGCGRPATSTGDAGKSEASVEPSPASSGPVESAEELAEEEARRQELKHHVVAADRILFPYVLLLEGGPGSAKPDPPTREALQAMIRAAFPSNLEDPEVRRLLAMIAREPSNEAQSPRLRPGGGGDLNDPNAYQDAAELLALLIEVVATDVIISESALTDFELTQGLHPEERASLTQRRWALVLRGEYRNQHGVRGLRLLQTLVRVVASEMGALVHDADTLETVNVDTFAARRLRAGIGNVADQIPVVPFPDPDHPGRLRLATRGMRRFGSVDLELAGLPMDPPVLARATFFLHGLALMMVRLGEVDRSGIAIEVPDVITVDIEACVQAYTGRGAELPRCEACPEEVDVHLVERDREPQDAPEHIVARVVAPRTISDATDYDQQVWVMGALGELFDLSAGAPAGAGAAEPLDPAEAAEPASVPAE